MIFYARIALGGAKESEGEIRHPDVEGYSEHFEELVLSFRLNFAGGFVNLWCYVQEAVVALSPSKGTDHAQYGWNTVRVRFNIAKDEFEIRHQFIRSGRITRIYPPRQDLCGAKTLYTSAQSVI